MDVRGRHRGSGTWADFDARSVRVAAAALAGTMALGAGLVFGPATPASANVTQVFSTDEDGAGGFDHYLSTDAIYAYVVTGFSGGSVCAAEPNAGCAAGQVPVPALTRGPVPVYPPRGLVPGEYEMIGFNQGDDAITARAGFTFVVEAATCDAPAPHQTVVDRQVCDENMQAFKVAADRMAERSRLVAALGLIGGRMLSSAGAVVFGPLGGAIVSLTIAAGGFRIFTFRRDRTH